MSRPFRLSPRLWLVVPLVGLGVLVWADPVRVSHVRAVSTLSGVDAIPDPSSPTGYAGGIREFLAPEHNNNSYQWIAETQQMLARGEWRLRHVDFDNAPNGRQVLSASAYRWWLGLVAWFDHTVSHRPMALAVERAALWADPLLHGLLVLFATGLTACAFGRFAAALVGVALVATFPLASAFLPGQPEDIGLAEACVLGSLLPLLAAVRMCRSAPAAPESAGAAAAMDPLRRARHGFFLAGCIGGFGLWINLPIELLIVTGLAAGGLLEFAFFARLSRPVSLAPLPWRLWGLGGALGTLVAYLVEYAPAHMAALRLETVHPLYGLAWLGAAELLATLPRGTGGAKRPWTKARIARAVVALLPVVLVPILAASTVARTLFSNDTLSTRLTNLPDGAIATSVWAWITRDGFTSAFVATCLPLLLLLVVAGLLVKLRAQPARSAALVVALGPTLVCLGSALLHLRGWITLDSALLALLVVAVADVGARWQRMAWGAGLLLVLAPGLWQLAPHVDKPGAEAVTESDLEGLIERDLAHWLAVHAGPAGAAVLAPPNLTTSLYFHGGLQGLGTPYSENKDGFAAAARIAGATSADEAQVLAQRRGVRYIVIPSWDPFLDTYARLGPGPYEKTLVALLHRWQAPRWLRPIPYQLPKVPGFEGQSAAIFEVVDVQDNALALSRLAEYFLEMDQTAQAASVSQALQHYFPEDLGALIAEARVAGAAGDTTAFAAAINAVIPYIDRKDDRGLGWDRRVSLAIALAEARRFDLAKEQVRQCIGEMDESRLRSLTTMSLFRLEEMSKAFGYPIADPQLRAHAAALLPSEARDRL